MVMAASDDRHEVARATRTVQLLGADERRPKRMPHTPQGGARRQRRRCAVVVALLGALAYLPCYAQTAKRDDSILTERKKLEQTQKQLREQREKAAEARRRETSLLAELEEIDRRLADKQRDIARLDAKIRRGQVDIEGLGGEIRKLETSRGSQQEALARRLRTLYKIQNQGGALPLLLTGDDSVTRAAVIRQLASVTAVDARLISDYRQTTDRLADRRGKEELRRRELAALRAEGEREQTEVDREAAKRRGLLARVRDERAYHERMIGELTEASRRLEAFIKELQAKQRRIAKAVPPPRAPGETPVIGFGELRGRLPWPTAGRILTAFGAQINPRFGTKTFRNGVDIEAAGGTEVASVYAGHVVYTGWFKGYGNLIILDHGHEYYTLYAHVAEILVKEGDDVRQSQRIGTVGDTGSLAGPRLYFEVRYQGKPQDPEQWLRQRG
jgi:septal ring factor EnvC (AmiA/AmiB activator)